MRRLYTFAYPGRNGSLFPGPAEAAEDEAIFWPALWDEHVCVGRLCIAKGDGGGGQTGGGPGGGAAAATTAASASSSAGPSAAAGGGGPSGGSAYNKAPWLFPPSDFVNLDIGPSGNSPYNGAVALPAIGATAIILTYTVPTGRNGKIIGLGIDFVANGAAGAALFTQGVVPPQLVFNILIDGRPVKNYGNFAYLPGQVSSPDTISGITIQENQVVTITVENVSVTVAAQFVAARIQGYLYSKKLHPEIAGYQS